METYLLQMGKNQMVKGWKSIDFAKYKKILGDPFHGQIETLYNKLESEDVESIDDADHAEFMEYFELVKDWITMLNYNSIEDYPQELVYSLKLLLKEWLADYDKYIILISDNPYMITYPSPDLDAKYQIIKTKYGLDIKHKILKICMPKMFVDDFLVNVCMYHEIGHFIDRKEELNLRIANAIVAVSNMDAVRYNKFHEFFPDLVRPYDGSDQAFNNKFLHHIAEYLADLFAAQYVGDNILMYLKYLRSHNFDVEDPEHPSPLLREKMVTDFLGAGNEFVVAANANIAAKYGGNTYSVKHHNNNLSVLGNLEKVSATNSTDVHSLLSSGWSLYRMDKSARNASHPNTSGLSTDALYDSVNSLIKESISDYSSTNPI